MSNPYNKPDDELLDLFHRENPDFDLMNTVNDEMHKLAAAPCRVYKLDISQSKKDADDIYPELIYRVYLPPIIVKMQYTEPTWTEELTRLGINMPEQVVFSVNLQRLMENIKYAKTASSSVTASINIRYQWQELTIWPFSQYGEPDAVKIYHSGNGQLQSKLYWAVGNIELLDPVFELNYADERGLIDLSHPAVITADKLADFIDGLPNYQASLVTGSNLDVLSSKMIQFAAWEDIKGITVEVMIERTGGVYDSVSDVLEPGDLIETFRRHEATRMGIEPTSGLDGSPTIDPVTLQPVRGKIYEVRYGFVASETPSWHYINYSITADKVPLDSYDLLLKNLPQDEPWTPGPTGKWYA